MTTPLHAWMRNQGHSDLSFARTCAAIAGQSVDKETMRLIRRGQRAPKPAIVRAIYVATDGLVDANALFGIHPFLLTGGSAEAAPDHSQARTAPAAALPHNAPSPVARAPDGAAGKGNRSDLNESTKGVRS